MTQPASNRREFLTGQAAKEAIAHLADARERPFSAEHPRTQQEAYLLSYTRRAMACDFAIYFPAGESSLGAAAALAFLDQVDQLEDQLSVYRATSEISLLNAKAALGPVKVEAGLFSLLQRGQQFWQETGGAFDLTAGPLSAAWGFDRRQGQVPSAEELQQALGRVGGQFVRLNSQRQTVEFTRPGICINVNALGKGYSLDCGAATVQTLGLHNALLHGGQSSVLAMGPGLVHPRSASWAEAASPSSAGWLVDVRHPLRPDRSLVTVRLLNQALSTSGSATQSFRQHGKRYGHILDPRTGRPAEGVLSATVIAASAAEAEALSTACFVLGWEEAALLCERFSAGLVLVEPGPKEPEVRIRVTGLQEGADFTLSDDLLTGISGKSSEPVLDSPAN